MKFVVACEMPESAIDDLRGLATELVYVPGVNPAQLRDHLAGAGVLVVAGTRVSPEMIQRAAALQLIVHAGSGPGDVAIEEASTQGVFVAHCPDRHAAAVAELALGLLLALDRRIVDHTVALREGRWVRAEAVGARGLAGRTLGILGYGVIGREVVRRARAFALRVLAWTPRGPTEAAADDGVTWCHWPRELARQSDMVTVLAVEPPGEVLVDAEFLQSLPIGASLVHLGHPGAVDEAALMAAVEKRRLRVAVDTFGTEPTGESGRFRSRLCELPGVVVTPRIATLTAQARAATADEVVRVVRAFVVSGEVRHCLNLCERSPATWQLVLRVRDQVGVMAAVLEAVRADGINAQEISSRVFTGAKAAWCTISLDERPSTEALEAIRALPDVLHLELRAVV